jgi:hypothetical protein
MSPIRQYISAVGGAGHRLCSVALFPCVCCGGIHVPHHEQVLSGGPPQTRLQEPLVYAGQPASSTSGCSICVGSRTARPESQGSSCGCSAVTAADRRSLPSASTRCAASCGDSVTLSLLAQLLPQWRTASEMLMSDPAGKETKGRMWCRSSVGFMACNDGETAFRATFGISVGCRVCHWSSSPNPPARSALLHLWLRCNDNVTDIRFRLWRAVSHTAVGRPAPFESIRRPSVLEPSPVPLTPFWSLARCVRAILVTCRLRGL